MRKSSKFSPEVRERLVRMVAEQRPEHSSQCAAIVSIAGKSGMTPPTLLNRVKQYERDTGQRAGFTSEEAGRIKELERENRELPCLFLTRLGGLMRRENFGCLVAFGEREGLGHMNRRMLRYNSEHALAK